MRFELQRSMGHFSILGIASGHEQSPYHCAFQNFLGKSVAATEDARPDGNNLLPPILFDGKIVTGRRDALVDVFYSQNGASE